MRNVIGTDVTGLMRREFASAKLCWNGLLLLQVAALILAVVAAHHAGLGLVVAGSGLALPILTSFLRARGGAYHDRGEEIRRALLLADGWGRKVDMALVLVRFAQATRLPTWDPPPVGSYYNSDEKPGSGRVLDILQQSAFFTARHAGTASWLSFIVALSAGTLGAGIIWGAAVGAAPFTRATDIGAALLTFAAGGELLSIGLAFHRLAGVANATVVGCETLARQGNAEPADVALVGSAYDSAVAQAPPIPSLLYRAERERLERAWAEYKGGRP